MDKCLCRMWALVMWIFMLLCTIIWLIALFIVAIFMRDALRANEIANNGQMEVISIILLFVTVIELICVSIIIDGIRKYDF